MRDIIKLAVILFVITAIAAVLLGMTNAITKDKIAEQIELENLLARQSVMPSASDFELVDQDTIVTIATDLDFDNVNIVPEVYVGKDGDNTVGYTFKALPKGFGGEITVLTGISSDGQITGVKVISHQETPGLGANATNPSFQDQYKNKLAETPLEVVKSGAINDNEIEAITGATITSKAVTSGVNFSIQIFNSLKVQGE